MQSRANEKRTEMILYPMTFRGTSDQSKRTERLFYRMTFRGISDKSQKTEVMFHRMTFRGNSDQLYFKGGKKDQLFRSFCIDEG